MTKQFQQSTHISDFEAENSGRKGMKSEFGSFFEPGGPGSGGSPDLAIDCSNGTPTEKHFKVNSNLGVQWDKNS